MVMRPHQGSLAIYRQLMLEIKDRFTAATNMVNTLRAGKFPHAPHIGAEFCFLQIRMMYEALALGCAVVHERLSAVREEWNAGEMIKALTGLHADFYPKPVTVTLVGNERHLEDKTEPYLTKEMLPTWYGVCGDRLHRGTGSTILMKKPKVYDLDDVVEQLNLLGNLLTIHVIKIADVQQWVRVEMDDNGDVSVSRLVREEDFPE